MRNNKKKACVNVRCGGPLFARNINAECGCGAPSPKSKRRVILVARKSTSPKFGTLHRVEKADIFRGILRSTLFLGRREKKVLLRRSAACYTAVAFRKKLVLLYPSFDSNKRSPNALTVHQDGISIDAAHPPLHHRKYSTSKAKILGEEQTEKQGR